MPLNNVSEARCCAINIMLCVCVCGWKGAGGRCVWRVGMWRGEQEDPNSNDFSVLEMQHFSFLLSILELLQLAL